MKNSSLGPLSDVNSLENGDDQLLEKPKRKRIHKSKKYELVSVKVKK